MLLVICDKTKSTGPVPIARSYDARGDPETHPAFYGTRISTLSSRTLHSLGSNVRFTDEDDVWLCRLFLPLVSVLVIAFWVVYHLSEPDKVDPLWHRIAIALIPLLLLGSSYLPWVRRRLITFWRALLYGLVIWFTLLAYLNGFPPAYSIGLLFVVAATSAALDIGLHSTRPIPYFLSVATFLPTGTILLTPDPQTNPAILICGLASFGVIFLLIHTSRVEMERALRASRQQARAASRLKSTIIGNISHELRTPLSSILGFADTLSNELAAYEREMARMIHQSATRLQRTLSTLIDLSELEANEARLEPERIGVAAHVEQAIEPFRADAREKGLTLALALPETSAEAHLNPSALERLVGILLDNAIKFTEDGNVSVEVRLSADRLQLTVADTGMGMSPDEVRALFDAFKQSSAGLTRQHDGLGLGLSLAHQLLELMNGSIDVESEPGQGSRFTISLPRFQDAPLRRPRSTHLSPRLRRPDRLPGRPRNHRGAPPGWCGAPPCLRVLKV